MRLTATVVFLGVEGSGRYTPPVSGFRPQIDVDGKLHSSCVVESLDGTEVFVFGQTYRVTLRPMFPERYPDAFVVGGPVRLFEGGRLIGRGEITAVSAR